jgi:lysophospholipase L1-like esterase
MAGTDRSWTIAPPLLWLCGLLGAGLLALDGDLDALADRLVQPREAPPAGATASFAPAPVVVAEAEPVKPDAPPPAPPAAPGERGRVGALDDVCLDGAGAGCKRWAMDGFYRAMGEARRGKLGRPLRVSWYGDSVIAGDVAPARLRTRLQRELGDGGPGFVFVVPPHRFCLHEGITRAQGVGEWTNHAISTITHPDGMYGAGGATAETYGASTSIKVAGGKVTRVELHYLAQKAGGTIKVSADGAEILRTDSKADRKTPSYAAATVPAGAARIKLELEKGRTRVFGLVLENAAGAVVDNLGIVSASVQNFGARDAAHFAAELGHRGADLVMIMLGANEATWLSPGDPDTKQYQARYEKLLEPIRKGRPDASCLVISPTDTGMKHDGNFRSRPVIPVLVEAQRKAAQAKGCKVADGLYEALTAGFQRYGAP